MIYLEKKLHRIKTYSDFYKNQNCDTCKKIATRHNMSDFILHHDDNFKNFLNKFYKNYVDYKVYRYFHNNDLLNEIHLAVNSYTNTFVVRYDSKFLLNHTICSYAQTNSLWENFILMDHYNNFIKRFVMNNPYVSLIEEEDVYDLLKKNDSSNDTVVIKDTTKHIVNNKFLYSYKIKDVYKSKNIFKEKQEKENISNIGYTKQTLDPFINTNDFSLKTKIKDKNDFFLLDNDHELIKHFGINVQDIFYEVTTIDMADILKNQPLPMFESWDNQKKIIISPWIEYCKHVSTDPIYCNNCSSKQEYKKVKTLWHVSNLTIKPKT